MPKPKVTHIQDRDRILCGAAGNVQLAEPREAATCKRCQYCLPSLLVLEQLKPQAAS